MQMSFPVGLVVGAFRWASASLTKILFLKTYCRSHELWAKHHRLGAHWCDCSHYFEYSIYLAQSTDPEPRTPKIAIRSLEKDIDSLSLVFEAESGAARFQDRIVLSNVGRKPIVWTLTNIPHQTLVDFHDGIGPRFSWDSYKLCAVQPIFKNEKKIIPFDTEKFSLTHTWFLNSTWKYQWQRFWNLDAIHCAKQYLREYWAWRFGVPKTKIYSANGYEISVGDQLITSGTRPIAWFMALEWCVSFQFWLLLWLRLCILDDENGLQWLWKVSPKDTDDRCA